MKKILIIEDEDTQRQLTEDILEINGYNTISVDNGKEGINLARNVLPDLIICDVIMPGYDGYKVLSELQKDPQTFSIPFVFVTGKSERESVRKGMDLGADDYIVKPFTDKELLSALNARLRKIENVKVGKSLYKKNRNLRHLDLILPKNRNVVSDYSRKLEDSDRVLLNVEKQPRLVKINNIKSISAVGDYSNVLTSDNKKFFVRKPMKEWEDILPEKNFSRIHRSTIINLDYIDRIEKWFNRAYKVYIQNVSKPFIISRRYGIKLKGKFS